MFRSITNNVSKNLSAGGELTGDVTITGDLSVTGSSSITVNEVIQGTSTIDVDSTEALLVRKNGDNGDILTVDTTNSLIKLGKNGGTPSALNIYGATNGNPLLIYEDTDNSLVFNFYLDSSDNSGLGLYANGASQKVNLGTTASSPTYFTGGNVGIGESSPDQLLHISGTAPVIRLQETANSAIEDTNAIASIEAWANDSGERKAGSIAFVASEQWGADVDDAPTAIIFNTQTNDGTDEFGERMRIESAVGGAPLIGIGTSSPTEALHISSSAASATPVLLLENTNANNLPAQINFYKNTSDEADDDWLGQIDFEGNDSGGNRHQYGRIASRSTDVSDGSEDGNIIFSTMKAGTLTETLRLESGLVGIGVTPTQLFHTESSINGDWISLIKNTHSTNGHGLKVMAGDNADVDSFRVSDVSNNTLLNVNGAGTATFSGNVGIGTADPTSDLDIGASGGGDLTLSRTGDANIVDGSSLGAIYFKGHDDTGSNVQPAIGAKIVGESAGHWDSDDVDDAPTELQFWTCNSSGATSIAQRMVINADGNIGIGVTPEASHSSVTSLQIGGLANVMATAAQSAGGSTWLGNNVYINSSGGNAYIVADEASLYRQIGGVHNFLTVASGSADASISNTDWTTNLVLDVNSRISLGNNDSSGATSNTIFGRLAGNAIASGAIDNVLIGNEAGNDITTGDYNVAIGANALEKETVGRGSIAIGAAALALQNTASEGSTNNIGIGLNAGVYNETGINNTLIGTNVAGGAGSVNSHSYNTAVGASALNSVTTGGSNVAMGYFALEGSLTGTQNTAIGTQAGQGITNSVANVSIGFQSMMTPSTIQYSVAIGSESMQEIQAGEAIIGVTAVGYASMRGVDDATTTGAGYGTAIGYQSLMAITTGGNNTAVGAYSGEALTTGAENTAIGAGAMRESTTGSNNVAVGREAMGLGITTGDDNVAIGKGAGYDITSATNNTIIGRAAGANLTDNSDNVVVGYEAFFTANSGENENVVIGKHAGYYIDNAGADENVIIGKGAGQGGSGDLTGCVVIGSNAMDATGSNDHEGTVAIGGNSLGLLTSGTSNTAVGFESLQTDDGANNTAVGYRALNANCGSFNTAVGKDAGKIITGQWNTVIGEQAGNAISSGSTNTFVGVGANGAATSNNQTAIGNGAVTDGANQVHIGNTSISEIEGQVSFATYSDKRIKTDIKDGDLGLDFIKLLKPKKFKKVNPAKYPDSIRNPQDGVDGNGDEVEWTDAEANKVWDGLIAQDVKEAIDACGTSYSGWREKKNSKQVLEYEALVVPLIKAVQELSAKVAELEKK